MGYFWKSILSILPSMIVPVLLGAAAISVFDFVGYSGVLLFAAPYSLVFCVFLYRFAMNDGERGLVSGMFGRIMKK